MENGQVNGTAVLQAKLNEPQVVGALTRLLDRIDSLEQTVEKLATAVEQAPVMISMATDTIDGAYQKAGERGIDIDERLRAALDIAEKLTAPAMIEKLNNLLMMADQAPGLVAMGADIVDDAYRNAAQRGVNIDTRLRAGLEIAEKLTDPAMLERLDKLFMMADQAPGFVAMGADIVDDAYRNAAQRGVNIDERLRAGMEIAEKLTAPEMVERLNTTLDMVGQGPGIVAMAMDIVDDASRQAIASGHNPETLLRQSLLVVTQLAELLESGEINGLLESGIIAPEAVQVVGGAAQAMVASRAEPIPKAGLFDMLRAMRDPELQRALGFLLNFGKKFGQNLDS